jgi:hypothetical protein
LFFVSACNVLYLVSVSYSKLVPKCLFKFTHSPSVWKIQMPHFIIHVFLWQALPICFILVILLGNAYAIVSLKCILCPIHSYRYWNYYISKIQMGTLLLTFIIDEQLWTFYFHLIIILEILYIYCMNKFTLIHFLWDILTFIFSYFHDLLID